MLDTFAVVAEPNRRRILDLLCREERSVSELVDELALSQPSVSKHLKVLREARLVHSEVNAQRRVYRLNPGPLVELDAWLEPYRRYWSERLDALGRHLDRHAAQGRAAPTRALDKAAVSKAAVSKAAVSKAAVSKAAVSKAVVNKAAPDTAEAVKVTRAPRASARPRRAPIRRTARRTRS